MAQIKSNAQVALECAASLFCDKKSYYTTEHITRVADDLLQWLDDNSGTVDLSK